MPTDSLKTTTTGELKAAIDQLASLPSTPMPFVSVYLNAQSDQHGKDQWEPFVRKRSKELLETFTPHTPEYESLEKDIEKIQAYLQTEVDPSSNSIIIFACSAENDFFLPLQLEAPIEENQFVTDSVPHIYPLIRLDDSFSSYAVLLGNTNTARLFTVGVGGVEKEDEVESDKMKRHKKGGWSQMRFQRHVDNFRMQHIKESVEALEKMVSADGIKHIILAGDEVVIPQIKEQLPKHLAEMVVDVVSLDIRSSENEILEKTLESFRNKHDEESNETAQRLIDEFRSQGLGVVGIKETVAALNTGKVDQLVICSDYELPELGWECQSCRVIEGGQRPAKCTYCNSDDTIDTNLREQILAKARGLDANIVLVEGNEQLWNVGGIGALLRFKA